MSLNPNARPFVFNPSAGSFTPGAKFSTPAAASNQPQISSVDPSSNLSSSAAPDSWEEAADNNENNDNIQTTTTPNTTSNTTDEVTNPANIASSTPIVANGSAAHMEDGPESNISSSQKTNESDNNPTTAAASTSSPRSATTVPASASTADIAASLSDMALDSDELAELAAAEAEESKKPSPSDQRVVDDREHINIVFIGHVDAGLLTGQVDERTIAKYEKEAKDKNRESWYLAYIMDTNEEERAKGKTVEVGRAHFTTAKKRYTLLDAPGHKNYVPNMIGGAAQADVGVLVISARRGEFEAGFERGGQTSEHALLAKTLGIQKLVVLVNKMDEKEVNWRKERYDQIESALTPYLKQCGFNVKQDVVFIPASGFTGANIRDAVSPSICPWYTARKSLFQVLDDFPPLSRDANGPLRLPIMARYKDMGALFVLGKLESGTLQRDRKLLMMPNKIEVYCTGLSVGEAEVDIVRPGENVLVKIKGIEEEDVHEGFVLSYPDRPTKRSCHFEATIIVQELPENNPVIAIGYECMLHVHVLTTECVLSSIVAMIDKKTRQPTAKKPVCLRQGDVANVRIKVQQSIAIELFSDFPALGRIILRDAGKGIAIGKITKIKEEP